MDGAVVATPSRFSSRPRVPRAAQGVRLQSPDPEPPPERKQGPEISETGTVRVGLNEVDENGLPPVSRHMTKGTDKPPKRRWRITLQRAPNRSRKPPRICANWLQLGSSLAPSFDGQLRRGGAHLVDVRPAIPVDHHGEKTTLHFLLFIEWFSPVSSAFRLRCSICFLRSSTFATSSLDFPGWLLASRYSWRFFS